ncbi:contactin-6-like [Crassostrea virginica]
MTMVFSTLVTSVDGQHFFNLTGSTEFAVLGKDFTWTCKTFIPPGQDVSAVLFFRNNRKSGFVGFINESCAIDKPVPSYTYNCTSESTYTLTIPAEKMTSDEEGSLWQCQHVADGRFKSNNVTLNIGVSVYNVSLFPSDNPLIIREGTHLVIECVVNGNATPTPTITWYLGSTDITNTAGNDTSYINITGRREDNMKTIQCRATNTKEPNNASTTLIVEYPPSVLALTQREIVEGRDLSVTCQATPGNPSSTTFFWTKDSEYKQKGARLYIPNIQRSGSGTYRCTVENNYSNGETGTHDQDMDVSVLFPPSVMPLTQQEIVEGSDLSVTCRATPGNPSSTTFFWTKVDNSGFRQNGARLQIPNIPRDWFGVYRCTAENTYNIGGKGMNSQEMVVNVLCRPIPLDYNITLGVTDTSGIEFSTTVIAYPRPQYVLKYENGTTNSKPTGTLITNGVNNFTFNFNQTVVKNSDFGTYHLNISNQLGQTIVFVDIIPQKRPDSPRNIKVTCEVTSARVQWVSSFNGGGPQTFTAFAYIGQQEASRSEVIDDGENIIHETVIRNLQTSKQYVFNVSAQNKFGISSSISTSCTTAQVVTDDYGSVAAGVGGSIALILIIIIILLLCLFNRRYAFASNIRKQIERRIRKGADTNSSHYVTTEQHNTDDRETYDQLTQTTGLDQYELFHRNENEDSHVTYQNVENMDDPSYQVTATTTIAGNQSQGSNVLYQNVEARNNLENRDTETKTTGSSKELKKPMEDNSSGYVNVSFIQ